MKAHELVDRAVAGRVLVYGSLPPHGRDLDLVARPAEAHAIEHALTESGFIRNGDRWASFAGCSVEAVELTAAAAFELPAGEVEALFDEARPIDGLERVVRPSPHHVALFAARRAVADGSLDEKRRRRLDGALAEDPACLERARERAPAWRLTAAVEALAVVHRDGGKVPAELRRRAAAERGRSARGLVERARPRYGAVVAFSGLDGSGKSSQAAALAETLETLGYDVTVTWSRIAWDDLIWRIGSSAKRLLAFAHRVLRPGGQSPSQAVADAGADGDATPDDPIKRMRERSALLTHAWTLTIALTNAVEQWRLIRGPLLRGGVVICDRYALDSIVALRYSYGSERRFTPARLLLRALMPRPVRAYFFDVAPETAFARKGEWGVEWLARHRELYREERSALGVALVDGERPREEICAEIARDVWSSI